MYMRSSIFGLQNDKFYLLLSNCTPSLNQQPHETTKPGIKDFFMKNLFSLLISLFLLKRMYCKECFLDANPATAKSSHFVCTKLDHVPRGMNDITRLSSKRISVKKTILVIDLLWQSSNFHLIKIFNAIYG